MTLQADSNLYKRVPCFDLEKRDQFLSCEREEQWVKLSPIWNDTKQILKITKKTKVFDSPKPTFCFVSPKPERLHDVMNSCCDKFVDVQVMALKVLPSTNIPWNQKQIDFQQVVLADESQAIYCELWGEFADSIQESKSYDMKYLKVMGDIGFRYLKTTQLTSVEPLHLDVNVSGALDQRDINELIQGPYKEISCKVTAISKIHKYKKCPYDWNEIPEANFEENSTQCPACDKIFISENALQEIVLNFEVTVLDGAGPNQDEEILLLSAWSNSLNELIDETEEFWALEGKQIRKILLGKRFRVKFNKLKHTVTSISLL